MKIETMRHKNKQVYLRSIGKWVHKDVNGAKILFHRFSNFLEDIK